MLIKPFGKFMYELEDEINEQREEGETFVEAAKRLYNDYTDSVIDLIV